VTDHRITDDLPDPREVIRFGRFGNMEPLLQAVIKATNERIAPAEILPEFYLLQERRAVRFHGRWAVFRVYFDVDENPIRAAMMNHRGDAFGDLARQLEHMMADAINGALRDLVIAEMQKYVQQKNEGLQRDIEAARRETQELTKRVWALEQREPWYRRVWKILLRPVW
jgi:hypothetical protein